MPAGRPSHPVDTRWVKKNPLGAALRLAREHRGLTLKEMSKALGPLLEAEGAQPRRFVARQGTLSAYEGAGPKDKDKVCQILDGYAWVLGYTPEALARLARGLAHLARRVELSPEGWRAVAEDHFRPFEVKWLPQMGGG